jgi:hypothetical protein
MRRIVAVAFAILASLLFSTSAPSSAAPPGWTAAYGASTASPNLLYIASRHLWLRSVDGGAARRIVTPWPMGTKDGSISTGVQWSTDARRVAVDDSRARLAVINLATGRITILLGRRCSNNYCQPVYAWSPSGRYLAFVQPIGSGEKAILRLWDSNTGKTHRLLGNIAAFAASPEWSHDGTRIAIETGTMDTTKNVFPEAVSVSLAGHVTHLGKGLYLSWSPDDRLIGIIRPNFCGANTCDEDEIVRSSTGGPVVMLARHSSSLFDNPIWAPQPNGYAFDRWLLNASGHPTRRVAGLRERVLSWRLDGSRLALQTYYPYQGTPDVLYLSTPTGTQSRVYSDGTNSGCGACSKDVYSVSWAHGNQFAFSTPIYPTPKNVTVHAKLFVSSVDGGSLSRIDIPPTDIVDLLGFVDSDQEIVIHASTVIYRYTVATHHLSTIATGVPAGYGTAILDPTIK